MPTGWHRNPEESIYYDEPYWCPHGINLDYADCGQCIQEQAEVDEADHATSGPAAEASRGDTAGDGIHASDLPAVPSSGQLQTDRHGGMVMPLVSPRLVTEDRELDAAETARQIQKFVATLAKLKGWT